MPRNDFLPSTITTAEVNIIQKSQTGSETNMISYINGTFENHKSVNVVSFCDPIPCDILEAMILDNETASLIDVNDDPLSPHQLESARDKNENSQPHSPQPQSGFILRPAPINTAKTDSMRNEIVSRSTFFNIKQSTQSISSTSKNVFPSRKYICWRYDCDAIYVEQLEHLIRELIHIRNLKHEHILEIHEIIILNSMLLVYTPFFSLGTCESALKYVYKTGMDYTTSMYIIKCVLEAVNYLHDSNIIHRSIRGRHILLSHDGRVVLSDFNSLYYTCDDYYNSIAPKYILNNSNVVFTIPDNIHYFFPWAAPEVLRQNIDGYSFESDIYSVGVTILELIFGVAPYSNIHPLKAFKAKICQENSIVAKAICIFTDKYFSKRNAILFFQRLYDQFYSDDDQLVDASPGPFQQTEDNIDYGYAKIFYRYSHKPKSFKFKLYKVVSSMMCSDPAKRHGTRTPLSALKYFPDVQWNKEMCNVDTSQTYLPYSSVNLYDGSMGRPPSYFDGIYKAVTLPGGCATGQLTKKGQQLSYNLGKTLKERYVNQLHLLDGQYNSNLIGAYSTNIDRTFDSMQSVLKGLFEDKINKDNIAVIHTRPNEIDYNYPNSSFCVKINEWMSYAYDNQYSLSVCKELKDKLAPLFTKSSNLPTPIALWDSLISMKSNGFDIPQHYEDIFDEVEKCAAHAEKFAVTGEKPEMMKLLFGKVMDDIISHMENAAKHHRKVDGFTQEYLKLWLTSCHDTTIFTLLTAMGGFNEKWPPLSSYLAFELFHNLDILMTVGGDNQGYMKLEEFAEKYDNIRLRKFEKNHFLPYPPQN